MSIVRFGMKFKPLSSFVLLAFLVCSSVAGFAHQSEDEVTPEVQQLYAQANAAQQSGNNVTAIEKYRTMIKLAPHLAAAYNNLGMLYFNEHDFVHAAEILERGLKLHQDMPTASAMLGMSYFQLGMDTKAEPYIYAAVKANPNDDQAQMALVRVQIKLGKYQEATLGLNHFL